MMADDTGSAFWFAEGGTPLLVSMPHIGTVLPSAIADRLTPTARQLADTDWHVDLLYDFAAKLGAHRLGATHSRYVIDLNRPPDDTSLYPGQATTGLCPMTDFDGVPLYEPGEQPDAAEVADRRQRYWQPYHDALAGALSRIVAEHGYALLYDAHSIRSVVPRLFDGELAELNIGTADGNACADELERRITDICRNAVPYSAVANGRFKGGYITRAYGSPSKHVHAVQMELAQRTYMDETAPYRFDETRAAGIRPVLRNVLEAMLAWGAETYG